MKGELLFFIGLQQPADAEKWDVFTHFFVAPDGRKW